MNRDDLERYESEERLVARRRGGAAVENGCVTNVRALYGDVRLPSSYGFHRRGAPLATLIFLYPTTVVFLPPNSAEVLEARLGMTIADFLDLEEAGIVRPVIGHPLQYADMDHFDELLRRKPPSVWARGDEMAHVYAGAAGYWDDARRWLPIAEMSDLPWVRQKWARQYPSLDDASLRRQVGIELCTNYVDLCIFGYQPLAERALTYSDPDMIGRRLVGLGEHLTYPLLLGMGGTPHYGGPVLDKPDPLQLEPMTSFPAKILGDEATILLRGLKLEFPASITPDAIKQFHKAGKSKQLWRAVEILETQCSSTPKTRADLDGLAETVIDAEHTIKDALREARDIATDIERRRIDSQVALTLKLASVASVAAAAITIGDVSPMMGIISGIGGTAILTRKPFDQMWQKAEDEVVDFILKRTRNPLATALWWVERKDE